MIETKFKLAALDYTIMYLSSEVFINGSCRHIQRFAGANYRDFGSKKFPYEEMIDWFASQRPTPTKHKKFYDKHLAKNPDSAYWFNPSPAGNELREDFLDHLKDIVAQGKDTRSMHTLLVMLKDRFIKDKGSALCHTIEMIPDDEMSELEKDELIDYIYSHRKPKVKWDGKIPVAPEEAKEMGYSPRALYLWKPETMSQERIDWLVKHIKRNKI